MTRFTSILAVVLLVSFASPAFAQTPAAPLGGAGAPNTPSAPLALPRVELGGGFTGTMPFSTGGDGFYVAPMINARVGVALNRRWALEGAFDIWPESDDVVVFYRAQARWLFRGVADPGRLQPHLTFGTAGGIEYESRGPFQWRDSAGVVHDQPRVSRWGGMPPIYPTLGVGVQKSLGAHVALRADVAAIIIPFDDGAAVLLMPSVSLSFPIGRYETRRK